LPVNSEVLVDLNNIESPAKRQKKTNDPKKTTQTTKIEQQEWNPTEARSELRCFIRA
jgi:hypothetical protein